MLPDALTAAKKKNQSLLVAITAARRQEALSAGGGAVGFAHGARFIRVTFTSTIQQTIGKCGHKTHDSCRCRRYCYTLYPLRILGKKGYNAV